MQPSFGLLTNCGTKSAELAPISGEKSGNLGWWQLISEAP